MNKAIFLALLLSLTSPAIAACGWEGDWLVCPGEVVVKQGIPYSETFKFSRSEAVEGKPYSFKYWTVGDFQMLGTKYLAPTRYSWHRYYEVNCQGKTITMLDNQYSGEWGDSWDDIQRSKYQDIGHTNFFMPGSFPDEVCKAKGLTAKAP